METKESEDLEKTQRKSRVISASDQQNIDNEPVEVKPELLPEKETSQADQDIQDKEPHSHSPIKRNSIFNRSIRRRSKAKARDTPERNASCLADSQDNGKSVNESLTLNVPRSRMPPWRTAVQTGPRAQKMSSQDSLRCVMARWRWPVNRNTPRAGDGCLEVPGSMSVSQGRAVLGLGKDQMVVSNILRIFSGRKGMKRSDLPVLPQTRNQG